jgi:hypothetical protein
MDRAEMILAHSQLLTILIVDDRDASVPLASRTCGYTCGFHDESARYVTYRENDTILTRLQGMDGFRVLEGLKQIGYRCLSSPPNRAHQRGAAREKVC